MGGLSYGNSLNGMQMGDFGGGYGATANMGMNNPLMSGLSPVPGMMGGLGGDVMAGSLGGAFDVVPVPLTAPGMYMNANMGGMDMASLGMGNMGAMGAGGGLSMSNAADDDEEAVVYQIAYGKPGPLGMDLAAHMLQYAVGPGQAVSAHVAVVLSGPPGSPMRPGDILLSVNGMSVVASAEESPGGEAYLAIVSNMLSSEAPPRVMRFFRSSTVDMGAVGAQPTWLHQRAASVFLDA